MFDPRKTALQLVRFLSVSGVSLAIDFGIYTALTESELLSSSWAKRVSFACILVWAFFAHKRFTFASRGFRPKEPLRFALLYLSGWALNSWVHDATAHDDDGSNLAFLAATIIWACWNFLGQKFFVFRK